VTLNKEWLLVGISADKYFGMDEIPWVCSSLLRGNENCHVLISFLMYYPFFQII